MKDLARRNPDDCKTEKRFRRQARVRRSFDGVVASYIRDISGRGARAHRAELTTG